MMSPMWRFCSASSSGATSAPTASQWNLRNLAFDFLTKPIDFLDLETTIAKTVRHIEVLREARRRQAEAERAQASLSRYFSPNPCQRSRHNGELRQAAGVATQAAALISNGMGAALTLVIVR